MNNSPLSLLNVDIYELVFKKLTLEEFLNLRATCKCMRNIVDTYVNASDSIKYYIKNYTTWKNRLAKNYDNLYYQAKIKREYVFNFPQSNLTSIIENNNINKDDKVYFSRCFVSTFRDYKNLLNHDIKIKNMMISDEIVNEFGTDKISELKFKNISTIIICRQTMSGLWFATSSNSKQKVIENEYEKLKKTITLGVDLDKIKNLTLKIPAEHSNFDISFLNVLTQLEILNIYDVDSLTGNNNTIKRMFITFKSQIDSEIDFNKLVLTNIRYLNVQVSKIYNLSNISNTIEFLDLHVSKIIEDLYKHPPINKLSISSDYIKAFKANDYKHEEKINRLYLTLNGDLLFHNAFNNCYNFTLEHNNHITRDISNTIRITNSFMNCYEFSITSTVKVTLSMHVDVYKSIKNIILCDNINLNLFE